MKYLPLHQSILNRKYKYNCITIQLNNCKFKFFKQWAINYYIDFEYRLDNIEIIMLFEKYMNDDIFIDWDN
jgi:hypothetical protein